MNKNQKLLLGVGVLAVAGYLLWQQSQKPKPSFANLVAPDCGAPGTQSTTVGCKCPCKNPLSTASDGTTLCANGHVCCGDKLGPCPAGGGPVGGGPKSGSLTEF